MAPDGTVAPNTFLGRRSDSRELFQGSVTNIHKALSPRQLAAFGDTLVGASDGELRFEAGGALKRGATVWLQARIPGEIYGSPVASRRHNVRIRLRTLCGVAVPPQTPT